MCFVKKICMKSPLIVLLIFFTQIQANTLPTHQIILAPGCKYRTMRIERPYGKDFTYTCQKNFGNKDVVIK